MYFGGVAALTPLHYLKMNGFPNNYWGWGGEDDDISVRWDFPKPPESNMASHSLHFMHSCVSVETAMSLTEFLASRNYLKE